jgi:NTP pyrophosphatase (non-canonical NTP hydrolase)
MTLDEYQDAAGTTERQWTLAEQDGQVPIHYHALKLAGEAGEIADIVGKTFTGKVTPREEIGLELGDALWHLARLAHHYRFTLEEIANANLLKLKYRHGTGFNAAHYAKTTPDGRCRHHNRVRFEDGDNECIDCGKVNVKEMMD